MSFVGGKLKLKGGIDPSQLKGGVKKKKKKAAAADALAVVPADGEAADGGAGGDQQTQVGAAVWCWMLWSTAKCAVCCCADRNCRLVPLSTAAAV